MAKPSERCRMVIRQWEILRLLESGPRTLHELSLLVGDGPITDRTVRRDVYALEAAGFPLYNEEDEDGAIRWRLTRNGLLPKRNAA